MMQLLLLVLTFGLVAVAVLLWLRAREQAEAQQFYATQRFGLTEGGVRPAGARGPQADPLSHMLQGFVLRAGVDAEHLPRWFSPVLLAAFVGVLLLGLAFGLMLAVLGLALLALVVTIWVMAREANRRNRMREQLPNFLEHMMRVLNAGNSLEEALAAATAECPEPLADVFRRVSRQVRLGAAIDETLTDVAQLSGLRELQVMAVATQINRRFGGSLKRVFKSLVTAIHQQDAARREMRALTAETRFSAMVLAVVPTGMMLYILAQNPDYYLEMWRHGTGQKLLILAAFLQLLGVIVIWRMLGSAGQEDR